MIAEIQSAGGDIATLQRILGKCLEVDAGYRTNCFEWQGALQSKGYPVMRVGGTIQCVHRIVHQIVHGDIQPGEQVHHKCLNKACVNPYHIVAVDDRINRALQTMGVGELELTSVEADCEVPF